MGEATKTEPVSADENQASNSVPVDAAQLAATPDENTEPAAAGESQMDATALEPPEERNHEDVKENSAQIADVEALAEDVLKDWSTSVEAEEQAEHLPPVLEQPATMTDEAGKEVSDSKEASESKELEATAFEEEAAKSSSMKKGRRMCCSGSCIGM